MNELELTDKILITNLVANGVAGIKAPERDHPQSLLINAILFVDLKAVGVSDDIKHSISYSEAAKLIVNEVRTTAYHTLEALAEHLAGKLLVYPPLQAILIRIEKPKFVKNTDLVGVEIYRSKNVIKK